MKSNQVRITLVKFGNQSENAFAFTFIPFFPCETSTVTNMFETASLTIESTNEIAFRETSAITQSWDFSENHVEIQILLAIRNVEYHFIQY